MEPQAERVVTAAKSHTLGQGKDVRRAGAVKLGGEERRMAGSLAGTQDGRKADELDRQQGWAAKAPVQE